MTGIRERVRIGRWLEHRLLAAPVDPSSLALFRILFGAMMAAGMVRFMALGWVSELYVLPTFHFTWELFPWVRPLPGGLMHLLFAALVLLACGVAAGFYYRASIVLFFLGFTYVELIDKATYLNHYYLVSLFAGLLICLPAHRALSIDVWRRPELAARTIRSWTVNLLRFQIAVVYVFAGLAKINADWLLEAQPMRIWLAARSDIPFAGQLFTEPSVAYAFSWFGAVYDLTIVLFLIWHRTRLAAYVTVIVFHVMTAVLFPIGMFPWIMIVATSIFFPPDWPRAWFKGGVSPATSEGFASHAITRKTAALIALYAAVQIALPLRGYWPGVQPEWTYRGFNFAWRVMLAEKAGNTEFFVHDPSTGKSWPVPLRDYVTDRQAKMMAQDPYMVRALARHIASDLRRRGMAGVEVRAESFAVLNGRPVQRLIDPRVDLASPVPPDWIVPLNRADPPSQDGDVTRDEDGP
jgi:vitamin K-dependent gamma-carboxylase